MASAESLVNSIKVLQENNFDLSVNLPLTCPLVSVVVVLLILGLVHYPKDMQLRTLSIMRLVKS